MSASLPVPPDVRHLADRDDQVRKSHAAASMPVQVAGTHLLPVVESSSGLQFAGLPPVPVHLHHVPSSSATSVDVVADAYNSSSSGSSACGDVGCVGNGGCGLSLGVALPAVPTRRMREFIPESKKDDEYWMKRQKNNEAAKRSREKRRANDAVMMRRIHELAVENKRLKLELEVLRRQLGVRPTTADSQPLPATAPALDAVATDDQLISRQNPEPQPPPSVAARYDDAARNVVTSGAYRSSGAAFRGDEKRWPEETHHHHHHHRHNRPASSGAVPPLAALSTEWPTTCAVDVSFSASSSDARAPASLATYRYSTSGNSLPSIANLCGGTAQLDNGGGGTPAYRSRTDGDRASSLPQAVVDSAPIVIFSDVSSSGDDSVDDSWFGKHVHTLTLRRSVEQVGARGVVESPLNLSTPSRHQSPARHACGADSSGLPVRRSSDDFAQASAPWLTVKTASELASEPVAGRRRGDDLTTRRSAYVCEPQGRATHAAEWLHASRNGSSEDDQRDQSSRSSVASVAWQAGVDVTPLPRPAADDVYQQRLADSAADHLPDGRRVSCGLPLKVRRKLGSGSTSRVVVDDAPRPQYDGVTLATRQLWSEDRELRPMPSGTQCSLSTEWFRSATAERSRLRGTSNFDVLDRGSDRYE